MRIRLCGFVICWMTCALSAQEREQVHPRFDPHPRLAITAAEWAARQQQPDFAALKTAAIQQGESSLQTPVEIPEKAGNWPFYYACNDDGTSLEMVSLTEHKCPRCGKLQTDERTVAAYRTLLHDRANQAALTCGWAYLYSGDERFARETQRILLTYADRYHTFPKRWDRWGKTGLLAPWGGRRYSLVLIESTGVIQLAKAYDLVRTSTVWTDEQRKHVEEDFFRPTADTLLFANLGTNHQTWINAGLTCIGSVLGDAELINRVLTMRGGLRDQLRDYVGADGLWYEGALAYHNYALQAMVELIEAGWRLGLPWDEEPKFKLMLDAPLRCAYPNGQFPAINDSDPGSIAMFDGHFQWAWNHYHDPRFARALARDDLAKLQSLLGPDARLEGVIPSNSLDLPDAGLAILRRGTGAQASCVMLDHGPHGGSGHGHFDKLNIVLFEKDREWLLDPGRLTYSHKEYKTWVKETVAHNTVTVGGTSQRPGTGKLLWLQETPDYAGCAATANEAYTGTKLTRYLLLTDSFLVDVFDVHASRVTQLDSLAHALSDRVQPTSPPEAVPSTGTPAELGSAHGYQHLTSGQQWPSDSRDWTFLAGADQRLRVLLAPVAGETRFTADGIGYHIDQRVPCLIRRVSAQQARFACVYDLSADGKAVTDITVSDEEQPTVQLKSISGDWKIQFTSDGVQCEK